MQTIRTLSIILYNCNQIILLSNRYFLFLNKNYLLSNSLLLASFVQKLSYYRFLIVLYATI